MPLPSLFSGPSMLRRHWLARGLLIAAGALAATYLSRNLLFGPAVDVYELRRGDLVQTVVASGRIITPQRVSVGAVITERVARIPVDGRPDRPARRHPDRARRRDERAAVAQAQAAVAQAAGEAAPDARSGLPRRSRRSPRRGECRALARQQYQRNQDLAGEGLHQPVGARRREAEPRRRGKPARRRAPAGASRTVRPAATMRWRRRRSRRRRPALEAAQARLDADSDPRAGRRRADRPQRRARRRRAAGQGADGLAPAGETQIVVQIDEKNLAQLALGQKALVSADAYPGERFAAELVLHQSRHRPLRGSVEVKLRVPQPPALPAPGHDGVGRHRGRAPRRDAWSCRPTPCATRAAPSRGCWRSATSRAVRQPGQARAARRRPASRSSRASPGDRSSRR